MSLPPGGHCYNTTVAKWVSLSVKFLISKQYVPNSIALLLLLQQLQLHLHSIARLVLTSTDINYYHSVNLCSPWPYVTSMHGQVCTGISKKVLTSI